MYITNGINEASEGLIQDMYVLFMLEGELLNLKARQTLNLGTGLQRHGNPYTIEDALTDIAGQLSYATTHGRFSEPAFAKTLTELNNLGKQICAWSWSYGDSEGERDAREYLAELH